MIPEPDRHLPLDGVRVVDLTTFLSGPFATQILADLGADVVKVESPGEGDSSRSIPPYFIDGDSAYFLSTNRNKRSIVLDLQEPSDGLRLKSLIARADIVVDNFRPRAISKLGLSPEASIADRPTLIWASITGFGQTGTRRDRPAYDMIVQALSGVMSMTGEPGGSAVRLGIPAGDTVAGVFAVVGILATLSDVRRGGPGRWIDISMLDAQLAMTSYQAAYTLISGVAPGKQGARHDSISTYRSFVGSDGREFVVTANTERMWRGMCRALNRPELISDPLFADSSSRLANRERLWADLESAFQAKPAAEWVRLLEANDVPCAVIRNVKEALDEARLDDRGLIAHVRDAERGEFDAVRTPIRIVGCEPVSDRFPPRLGANQDDADLF